MNISTFGTSPRSLSGLRPSVSLTEATEHPGLVVLPANYVTVKHAARLTGMTEKAIRRKIECGKWIEGREYFRSADGGVFVSLKGYEKWVERGRA